MEPDNARPGDLRAPLLLGAALALMATMAWRPLPTGIWHDDGVYLLIAKALANGDGLRYAGVVGLPAAAKFPPLYPLTLVPFWLLGEDVAAGSGWLAAMNVIFMAAAAAAFAWFLQKSTNMGAWAAAGVAALAWASPQVWKLTAIPLSEPLFVLAVTVGLATAGGAITDKGRWRPLPFLAAFAVAYHTRTIAVALLAAAVLGLLAKKRPLRGTLLALAGGAIMLPWMLWSARATGQIAEPFRDLLGSYGPWLAAQVADAPHLYGRAVLENVRGLGVAMAGVLAPGPIGFLRWPVSALAAVAGVLGIRAAWRAEPLLVLFPLTYVAILVLWPYRSGRLIAPALPFAIAIVVLGALATRSAFASSRARRAWTVAVAGAGLWMAGHGLWTMASGEHLRSYVIRARTLARAVEVIERTAPEDAVIGAPELWAALHLHTGRTVAPSARFRPLDPGGVPWGSPAEQYKMWTLASIDHVLVEHGGRVHGSALDQVDATCDPGTVQLLASFPGPSFFVRLGWDQACRGSLATAE